MGSSRIKQLFEEVEFTYLKLKTLNQDIKEANSNGKKGKSQQLIHTRTYLFKKLFNLRNKLKAIIKGSVCNIQYECNKNGNSIVCNSILVNVSDEEILDILKLYCKLNGYQFIRILEIQRIHTKLF